MDAKLYATTATLTGAAISSCPLFVVKHDEQPRWMNPGTGTS